MRWLTALFVLSMTVSAIAQSKAISDNDWKRWVADVDPLLTAAEKTEAKKTPAQEREAFREAFWARRNPAGAASADNAARAEFERRVAEADKRFRDRAGWNDCGRTFVLFGKPDKIDNRLASHQFSSEDRLKAMREQDDVVAEAWFYRNPPGLPAVANGYSLRFSQNCESMMGPAFYQALQRVADSYVVAK